MSSGAQVDMDWAGTDAGQGGAGAPSASAPNTGAAGGAYLTDEEILGIDPHSPKDGFGGLARDGGGRSEGLADRGAGDGGKSAARDAQEGRAEAGDTKTAQAEAYATAAMPAWMAAVAADPKNGAEAQTLWREHQEFRAAFASPEEARAVKELLPGGVRDVLSLREATQSVERIDAAIFSGDVRAQSEVVAEMARANPAAFRAMFAEAAKVLAGMGERGAESGGREARSFDGSSANGLSAGPTLHPNSGQAFRKSGEGWGTQNQNYASQISNLKLQDQNQNQNQNQSQNQNQNRGPLLHRDEQDAGATTAATGTLRTDSGQANHESHITNQPSQELRAGQSPKFDPAAYAAFERSTNDAVARDVRGSISDTLARVMPEGVADGAARRIGEDIFTEVHRALAADRSLSEQVASVLREPPSPNGGYGGVRFGAAEQQRVAALVAGRAKQLVPSVARRVIGEWTGTVLNTARSKAARQAAAASRVDIAAPGGSLDSMPLRAMSAREVNYGSMSDEEILGM